MFASLSEGMIDLNLLLITCHALGLFTTEMRNVTDLARSHPMISFHCCECRDCALNNCCSRKSNRYEPDKQWFCSEKQPFSYE